MSEIKLKPCPFCGGEAKILNVDDRYTVKCRSCFCGTGIYKDSGRASEAWNRRAENESRTDKERNETRQGESL